MTKAQNIIGGYMCGLGKMLDIVGTLIGEYRVAKNKSLKSFLMGYEFSNNLVDKEYTCETSLEFKIAKIIG